MLNGVKRWITNAGISEYYTVMAVTDPAAGASGISAFVLEDSDPGFTFGAPEHKLGIKGSPTRELYFDDCAIPASYARYRLPAFFDVIVLSAEVGLRKPDPAIFQLAVDRLGVPAVTCSRSA